MNKRIRELYDQSLVIRNDDAQWIESELDSEKFAELIVAEAVAVVQRRFMGDLNREDLEVRRCVEELKLHFGVEE